VPINISVLDDRKAIFVEADGDITASEVHEMRKRSVELVDEKGIANFLVDIRKLRSLEGGRTSAILDLGTSFSEVHLTVWSNTAVLMPEDESAHEQLELLYAVEINRGRGIINYVESFEEAFSWFEEMDGRV
jgi:hypothetical protein